MGDMVNAMLRRMLARLRLNYGAVMRPENRSGFGAIFEAAEF
jgi:hypothetical protein